MWSMEPARQTLPWCVCMEVLETWFTMCSWTIHITSDAVACAFYACTYVTIWHTDWQRDWASTRFDRITQKVCLHFYRCGMQDASWPSTKVHQNVKGTLWLCLVHSSFEICIIVERWSNPAPRAVHWWCFIFVYIYIYAACNRLGKCQPSFNISLLALHLMANRPSSYVSCAFGPLYKLLNEGSNALQCTFLLYVHWKASRLFSACLKMVVCSILVIVAVF